MPRIHHVAIEIDSLKVPHERFLWEVLGFGCPYPMTRLVNGRQWFCCIEGDCAINLLPRKLPNVSKDAHLCISIDDRERFKTILRKLDEFQPLYRWEWEETERYINERRIEITAPSGYKIEVLQSSPPIRTAPSDQGAY